MTPFGRVGKNEDAAGLNESPDWNYPLSKQIIKGRQNAFIPDIRQMSFYLPSQSSEPMLLTGSADTAFPCAGPGFGCYA
jgi:hypothetical protein